MKWNASRQKWEINCIYTKKKNVLRNSELRKTRTKAFIWLFTSNFPEVSQKQFHVLGIHFPVDFPAFYFIVFIFNGIFKCF